MVPGPIEEKKVEEVDTNPIKLPEGFEWSNIDMFNKEQAEEVFELLDNHYVEDTGGSFRFRYSVNLIRWAICVPNYKPKWHIGVRATKTKKLLAFIAGLPANLNVLGNEVAGSEINFLCIHKKLREKRLAPVLIKEVTRRINRANVWQAIYTSGTLIPKPYTAASYYSRAINKKKLVDIGFSKKPKNKAL